MLRSLLLAMVGFGVVRAVRTWLPVWGSRQQRPTDRAWQTAWLVLGPLAVYLSVAVLAVQLSRAGKTDEIYTGLAWTLFGFFLIVLRYSWNLLFQVAAEKHRGT